MKHLRIYAWLFALSLLFGACKQENVTDNSNQGGGESTTLSGTVHDEQGYLVPGALVSAKDAALKVISTSTSNEAGEFNLSSIPADVSNVSIDITHEEFKTGVFSAKEVIATAGEKRSGLLFSMTHADSCCAFLKVTVSDANTKNVIEGAELKLYNKGKGDRPVTTVKTTASGIVTFENLCQGTYNLRISKDGYKVDERPFVINYCDSSVIDSRLMPTTGGGDKPDTCCNGVLTVIAVDEANMPIEGADAYLISRKEKSQKTTLAGVTFTGLCAGKDVVVITKEGYQAIEFAFEMKCNGEIRETRTMKKKIDEPNNDSCCKGTLLVTAVDADKLVGGVEVKLIRPNGKYEIVKTTETNGALFDGLCVGKHSLRVAKEGYKVVEMVFEQECNEAKLLRITLSKTTTDAPDSCCNGTYSLMVKNKDGGAMNGAAVKLQRPSGKIEVFSANDLGAITFTKLCQGRHVVWATKEGFKTAELVFEMKCNDRQQGLITLEPSGTTGADTCCNGIVIINFTNANNKDAVVNGKVKLYKNGVALPNIATLSQGKAVFEKMCKGAYSYLFTSETYKAMEGKFEIDCNGNVTMNLTAVPNTTPPSDSCCNGRVAFSVLDASGAKIGLVGKALLYLGNKQVAAGTVTGGRVVFEKLCMGRYVLKVSVEGYTANAAEFTLECNGTYEGTIKLNKTGTGSADSCNTAKLSLRVKEVESNPELWLAGAEVIMYNNAGKQVAKGVTSQEGYFKVTGLIAPMTYTVSVAKDGYQAGKFTISFRECILINETVALLK